MRYKEFKENRLVEMLMENWGMQRIPDLLGVFSITKPRVMLEIGCWAGVSTEFWCLHCAHVIAIDPWPDSHVQRMFYDRCSAYPNLVPIRGYSPTDLPPPDNLFDMCYIDGDHSYHAVKQDILACKERTRPGGWIAGHDYGGDCPGVKQAVDEIFGEPKYRFSDGSWAVHY